MDQKTRDRREWTMNDNQAQAMRSVGVAVQHAADASADSAKSMRLAAWAMVWIAVANLAVAAAAVVAQLRSSK